MNAKWKLPRKVDRLLSDLIEADFWQADHKVAVAEGGGGCGLDNLRTLCVSYVAALLEFLSLCFDFHSILHNVQTPCHSKETEQLLARLKTLPDLNSKGQMDIYAAFSNSKSNKKKRKRRMAD